MKKKIKIMIVGLVAVLLATSTVYAQRYAPTAGGHPKEAKVSWRYIAKELNLTPEQEKKLQENQKKQHEEISNLFKALKEEREKLQAELQKPDVTKAGVKPIVDKIKSLQAQILEQRINGIFAVKEILTPEQFAKFQQMTEKRWEHRRGFLRDWRQKRKY